MTPQAFEVLAPDAPSVPQLLDRCRDVVRPALTEAVGRLHPWLGEMAAYSFGPRYSTSWPRLLSTRSTASSESEALKASCRTCTTFGSMPFGPASP